jgi:ubiquinone/menaquinone biosynthesis C-methylase UbiE
VQEQALPVQPDNSKLSTTIGNYWNEHIHDLEIATEPVGSAGFFEELAAYRFDKLRYLPRVVDFAGYRGQQLLEVGCGAAIDLVRFAQGGAQVTGIDLAPVSINLARENFAQRDLPGEFHIMNGEAMTFADDSFEVVYAHGVLQYTADAGQMAREIHRVLKPGGTAIMMVYNRVSWLNFMSKLTNVGLEHEDAPVLKKYSITEFREILRPFSQVNIIPERFPVKTRLHKGLKAALYNQVFVNGFNLLPRALTRRFGWHLMAFAQK